MIERIRAIVGPAHVVTGSAAEDFEHDATFMRGVPLAAVRPGSTEEVAAILAACQESGVPVVPRGAGTSLVGGSVPPAGAIVLSLDRLDRLEIDAPNTMAVAGGGVITLAVDEAAAAHGLMYPPDPASVGMCSIGGNVACNSGGIRCLKYGVTADYVTGMTVVLAGGRILRLGGKLRKRASGYRLMQLFIGSEGTLGIVTEVVLKLIPRPRHRATAMVGFDRVETAARAVSRVLAAGHFPAALELMDLEACRLVERWLPPGFEPRFDAVLIVEQDGNDADQVAIDLARMVELLDGVDNRIAQSSFERDRLWEARRGFGKILMAMPNNNFSEDVAVPIASIPEMIRRVRSLAAETGLRICTVGHAGDGNLHPVLIFDEARRPAVSAAAARIFEDALALGGTISAEHGLGALKRDFAEAENGALAMELMGGLKRMLDPAGLLNPGKVFPAHAAGAEFLNLVPGWLAGDGGAGRRMEAGV